MSHREEVGDDVRRVVAGIDGSSSSTAVVAVAAREARCRNAVLNVVSVWSFPPVTRGERWSEAVDRLAVETAEAAQHQIEVALGPVGQRAVEVDLSIQSGSPSRGLLDASADADLLVIGRRDKSPLKKLWLGSVADQCVRHATAPTMVLPAPNSPGHAIDGPIVVGLDGSDHSSRALGWALAEARLRNLDVRAVHCWTEPPGAPGNAAGPSAAANDPEAAARGRLDSWIADATHPDPPSIETRLRRGDPADVLLAEAEGAAMVVVGTRGRGGFAQLLLGSVSRNVASEAAAPVVLVR